MGNRLYVSNLPLNVSERSLSAHFASCGKVSEVQIVADRETARSRSFAFVTMQTEHAAEEAIRTFDGQMLDGRALRVSTAVGTALSAHADKPPAPARGATPWPNAPARPRRAAEELPAKRVLSATPFAPPPVPFKEGFAPRDESTSKPARGRGAVEARPAVRITQQFRERHNMTCELDCVGVPLIIRIFFPVGDRPDAEWRIEARTSNACDSPVAVASAPSRSQALQRVTQDWPRVFPETKLDWDAIAQALTAVRAL